MTDPYAPFPAGPTAVPALFPRARLERAGVPAAAVDELEAAFPNLSAADRDALVDYVNGHSDAAIAERYGDGPPPAPVTRETLENETVDDLEARIRAWNAAHENDPDAHLAVSGRKGELIGRLLDAYEEEAAGDTAPPAAPAAPAETPSTVATGTVPTAPTPTTPEGAPTGTQAAGDAGTAPAATATTGTTTSTGGTP
jgi:hypothetical protein